MVTTRYSSTAPPCPSNPAVARAPINGTHGDELATAYLAGWSACRKNDPAPTIGGALVWSPTDEAFQRGYVDAHVTTDQPLARQWAKKAIGLADARWGADDATPGKHRDEYLQDVIVQAYAERDAAVEIAWLRRLLRWCRPRLKHDSYQARFDASIAAGPTAALEDEPAMTRGALT